MEYEVCFQARQTPRGLPHENGAYYEKNEREKAIKGVFINNFMAYYLGLIQMDFHRESNGKLNWMQ